MWEGEEFGRVRHLLHGAAVTNKRDTKTREYRNASTFQSLVKHATLGPAVLA
jgi:hypothetical protein